VEVVENKGANLQFLLQATAVGAVQGSRSDGMGGARGQVTEAIEEKMPKCKKGLPISVYLSCKFLGHT